MGYTVLLADEDKSFRDTFGTYLKGLGDVEEVILAQDGRDALAKAEHTVFDFAFINAIMSKVDGCVVGATLKRNQPALKLIMLSCMCNEDTQKLYGRLGSAHCFAKPFNFEDVRVLWSILKESQQQSSRSLDNSERIRNLLIRLGCCEHLAGFAYLCEAVKLVEKSDNRNYKISALYAELAELFQTSPYNVERNIRYVIEQAWNVQTEDELKRRFGQEFTANDNRPTNKDFIAGVLKYWE